MTREMTYAACTQHGGWQAAMQFLHQRQDLNATPEVGQIECIISDRPFTSMVVVAASGRMQHSKLWVQRLERCPLGAVYAADLARGFLSRVSGVPSANQAQIVASK
jgi:hypothetical protein